MHKENYFSVKIWQFSDFKGHNNNNGDDNDDQIWLGSV